MLWISLIKLQFKGENWLTAPQWTGCKPQRFQWQGMWIQPKALGYLFFCGWRDIFCPLKSVLSPQIQHLGNISPDMTYFSFPRNIPWTLTSINVFQDSRPWGVEKKCYICEYHHAASKLDKLNGAVKKHIHQKFKSDFYTLMAEVTNNTNKIPTEIESLQTNCSLAGQPPLPSTVRHITEITGNSHSSKSFEFYSQFWKNHQLSLCTHICIHLKLLFEVQMHLAWPSWVLKDHFSPAWSTPHVVEALQIAQKLQISIPKDGHLICYKKLLPFLLSHEH